MENKYTNIIKDTNNEVTRQALYTISLLYEFLTIQVKLTDPNLTTQEQFQDIFERTTEFEQRVIRDGETADLEYVAPNPHQGELDSATFTLSNLNGNVSLCNSVEFTVKGCADFYTYNIQDINRTLLENNTCL